MHAQCKGSSLNVSHLYCTFLAQVLPSGEYVPPPHKKLNFGSMVWVRSVMNTDQALHAARAATIAIRYSCVRRQGTVEPGCM